MDPWEEPFPAGRTQTVRMLTALGIDPDNMPAAPERQYDSSKPVTARKWVDVWAAGQGLGSIHAEEPVAAVVDRLAEEYAQARARMAGLPYAQMHAVPAGRAVA